MLDVSRYGNRIIPEGVKIYGETRTKLRSLTIKNSQIEIFLNHQISIPHMIALKNYFRL